MLLIKVEHSYLLPKDELTSHDWITAMLKIIYGGVHLSGLVLFGGNLTIMQSRS